MGASESPGLFDPKGFLWLLSFNELVKALEALLSCASRLCLLTEVILSKQTG